MKEVNEEKFKTKPNQTIILSHFSVLTSTVPQDYKALCSSPTRNIVHKVFQSEASEKKAKNSRKAPEMNAVLWIKHLAVTSHSARYCKGTEYVQLTLENGSHNSEG